jgi:4-hydroxyphenylacetate 3-monooxygenase
MGRTPDFKASFLSTLGSYPDLYAPYQDNARRWYRTAQERLPNVGHALANPPVDRNLGAAAVRGVHVSVQKETDAGLVVSGAKVVATGAVLTNYTFIGSFAPIPAGAKEFAAAFLVRTDAPGVKLLCRPSYEYAAARAGSPFYYPLSSRFDENDAIVVFDDVLVPWEDVLCYDVDQANRFPHDSGFLHRGLLHGCVRLAVKFDFLCGLLLKGVELTGAGEARGVQTRVGELLSYRNLFWSCVHAMVERAVPWPDGTVVPNPEACAAYRLMATTLYPRARQIFLQDLSSSMVYTGSDPAEWHAPDVRPYFDRYLRGTGDRDAEQRVKLMRLIWDAIGSEFGGRHELYELNYAGNHEVVRLENLRWARESGQTRRYEEFVERCMSEYDTTGWTQPF